MKKSKLTIFTPTYNRGYCLPKLYESLKQQSNPDFVWLIIDDGSTDGTQKLAQKWKAENSVPIEYIFQENQGMHGAHNTAYENINTEWNTCIDSDDYLPHDAVEIILKNCKTLNPKLAGIVGLDFNKNGQLIGTKIPEHLQECTLGDLYEKHKVKGDKKLVYRTEIVKKYPKYPLFPNESFVPLGYLYTLIDQDYLLKPINEAFVIVEYQNDGSSLNIHRQYRKNPRGFAFNRISKIKLSKNFKAKFKHSIHLISCALFTKDITLLKQIKKPFLLLLALPFGLFLNLYIRSKTTQQTK
jgi:glycosyltransferase involved in cell wall biosynthesis